jgi:hypothetical protein
MRENNTKNSLTECNSGKTKKLSSGRNSTIKLKKRNCIRPHPHNSQSKHTLVDAITFFTPIVMLTPNGQFFIVPLLHSVSELGSCHTGQCMRCDGDKIRLRYDYTILFKWGLTHWRRHDTDTITTGRFDTIRTQLAFSSIPQTSTISPHTYDMRHKRRQHQGNGSAASRYIDLSEETNSGIVGLIEEHATLFP